MGIQVEIRMEILMEIQTRILAKILMKILMEIQIKNSGWDVQMEINRNHDKASKRLKFFRRWKGIDEECKQNKINAPGENRQAKAMN